MDSSTLEPLKMIGWKGLHSQYIRQGSFLKVNLIKVCVNLTGKSSILMETSTLDSTKNFRSMDLARWFTSTVIFSKENGKMTKRMGQEGQNFLRVFIVANLQKIRKLEKVVYSTKLKMKSMKVSGTKTKRMAKVRQFAERQVKSLLVNSEMICSKVNKSLKRHSVKTKLKYILLEPLKITNVLQQLVLIIEQTELLFFFLH